MQCIHWKKKNLKKEKIYFIVKFKNMLGNRYNILGSVVVFRFLATPLRIATLIN